MTLLIAGVLLWSGAHLFPRLAPDTRARMGGAGKGLIALLLVVSVVLMVLGHRAAPFTPLWEPPAFLRHVNNLLVLLAFWLFFVGRTKGTMAARIRHPQLTAVKAWAVAHLLVNGDAASMVLFGGLLAWAVAEVIVINRSEPWDRPAGVSVRGDLIAAGIGLAAFAIAAGIHVWLGVNPFGG